MKTIGLIGGMSWQSSAEYYRIINERVAARLGDLHSAKCVLYSVDFGEIEPLQHAGKWAEATENMVDAARAVERARADLLVLCTNTMHKLAEAVQAALAIPLLHIADATAVRIKAANLHKVGLLGTRFTMEEDFYRGRLGEKYGLKVLVPDETDRQVVHAVIYNELCRGVIKDDSRRRLEEVVRQLASRGCKGIILGCTEIGLLIKPEDSRVPLFDTTVIHAEAAVDIALS